MQTYSWKNCNYYRGWTWDWSCDGNRFCERRHPCRAYRKNAANLEKVAEELDEYGVNVSFAAADVADNESVIAAVEHVKSELGPIDILINNAGIGKFGKFLELISRGIQANYRCQPDGHVLRHTRSSARND